MNNKFTLGFLAVIIAFEVDAVEWKDVSWEQRWAASNSICRLALEVQRKGDIDSALVLITDALQAHPSNYRIYHSKWVIIVHVAPRFSRRDSLTTEEMIKIIRADLQTIFASDHNEDQIFVASLGYDFLYELTRDSSIRDTQRRVIENYLAENPGNIRTQDFLCILARLADSPKKALRFYRQALTKSTRGRKVAVYRDMVNLGIESPSLLSAKEISELFRKWEAEIQADPKEAHDELNEVHMKWLDRQKMK